MTKPLSLNASQNEFYRKVLKLIKMIPAGKVASYGQIAKLAGKEQGSRAVGWILHSSSSAHSLPWHRVLNSQGKISFPIGGKYFREQKKRLEAEGVVLSRAGALDLEKFQWKKKAVTKARPKNTPKMFS